nr:carboxymuconolactone decarboxylase family protein [uncultured Clostridium sp.]
MNRIQRSEIKRNEQFVNTPPPTPITDPDFQEILNRFIFGEVFYQGDLDDRKRELITIVVLTTNQTLPQLKSHIGASLNIGLTPVEIKEAIYQCAPYLGFPKTLNAITEANNIFQERNIALPIQSQQQVDEDTRFDEGIKMRAMIFGDGTYNSVQNAPLNQKHIQEYLCSFCFGDFYTRSGLDLKTRELLTLCIVSALGGCESQVKSHVQGNLNVGNDKEIIITAITQCLPYIGFPRTLNALNCINEIIPEN